jgi:hypothetical protein
MDRYFVAVVGLRPQRNAKPEDHPPGQEQDLEPLPLHVTHPKQRR